MNILNHLLVIFQFLCNGELLPPTSVGDLYSGADFVVLGECLESAKVNDAFTTTSYSLATIEVIAFRRVKEYKGRVEGTDGSDIDSKVFYLFITYDLKTEIVRPVYIPGKQYILFLQGNDLGRSFFRYEMDCASPAHESTSSLLNQIEVLTKKNEGMIIKSDSRPSG